MYYEQQDEKLDLRTLLSDPSIREEIMTEAIIKRFEEEDIHVTKEMVERPMLNQHRYKVSDEKIKQTGFIPRDCIEEGIGDTLDLFRNII